MGATRLLDRIEDTVSKVLEARVPPDDDLEWAVGLVPVVTGCEEHEDITFSVAFHAVLQCPEVSRRVVVSMLIPVAECGPEELSGSIHSIWERMVFSRLEESAGLGSS